jgi:hypothetical protein
LVDLKIKSLNDNYNYYRIFLLFCPVEYIELELKVMQLALLAMYMHLFQSHLSELAQAMKVHKLANFCKICKNGDAANQTYSLEILMS